MKHYSSYKDSGVEWIGEIPKGWEITKLKFSTDMTMGQSPSSEHFNEDDIGFPFLQGNSEFGNIHPTHRLTTSQITKKSKKGDILFSVRGSVGEINWSDQEYCIGRGLCSLTPTNINPKLLWFLLIQSKEEFLSNSVGSTFVSVNTEDIRNLTIPLPPLSEQNQIVSYLDDKTTKIDSLIQSKQKKITLLKEKRTSLINHIITKGLNPNVEMKDSGVEWIGEIPSHWKSTPLKRMVSIGSGRDYKHIEVDEGGYPVLGTGGIFSRCSEYLHTGPSVLLGRKGTIDNPLFIDEPFWTSDTIYYTVINEKRVLPRLLYHLVHQIPFSLFSYGSTIPSMTKTDYEEMNFPLPPLSEQHQIVQYLDNETSLIDKTISIEERKIELLKEYKQSLISDVVTGKICVLEDG